MAEPSYIFQNIATLEVIKRRRQKNLRIRVKGEQVIVSAPYYCSKKVIHNFIKSYEQWALKAVEKQSQKRQSLDSILSDKKNEILIRGIWKPLIADGIHTNSNLLKFTEDSDSVRYRINPFLGRKTSEMDIKKAANNWLKKQANQELKDRIIRVGKTMPFSWNKIYVRSQKTKWGTCSSKKNISLNWRIIKTPLFIWDYLIVHELCHTVHMNHSKDYWSLVEFYFPERKKAEKWLRDNESLIFEDSLTD